MNGVSGDLWSDMNIFECLAHFTNIKIVNQGNKKEFKKI